jgi:hypothetical protein
MNFNSTQVTSAARTVLGWLGVWLLSRGYLDENSWASLSGAIMGILSAVLVIVPFVYGIWVRRTAGLVATVAKLPEVSEVKTTQAIATKVDAASTSAGAKVSVAAK